MLLPSPDISYVHRGLANGRDQINILCEIGGSGTAFRPLSANLPPDPPGVGPAAAGFFATQPDSTAAAGGQPITPAYTARNTVW